MNIKEYIGSGILEAYALGTLSGDEAREVAANIVSYPELARELEAIENTMLQFAQSSAPPLPQGLEDKIWHSIQEGKTTSGSNGETGRTITFQPEYRKPAQWKLAAAIAALVGSAALNVILWNNSNKPDPEMQALAARVDSLSNQRQQLALVLDNYQKAKSMMADTGMQTIVMHTMQKGQPMAATLYWSKDKGEAYVSVDGLPPAPAGMQYQLWAIQGGKPVDMGMLPNEIANTPSLHKVDKTIMSGEAFAISLEKEGGQPAPTMEMIYVMGKA